jgi:hypothetical protein
MRSTPSTGFRTAPRHTYRMELTLEFSGPVSGTDAREAARRILDALRLSAAQGSHEQRLQSARLVCHDLRRIIALELPSDDSSPEPRA